MQAGLRALCYLEKEMPVAPEVAKKKQGSKAPKGPKYIQPSVEKFRRTKEGARLIRQEIKHLLAEECRMFPHRPMVNANNDTVLYSDEGVNKSISMDTLMEKAPAFFSIYYTLIRNKVDYGSKVQSWLKSVTCLIYFFAFFV